MPYTSVTLAALRGQLQARYTGDPFWTAVEATDAINEALRYFNLFTGYWRGSEPAITVAGSPFLDVPGSLTYRARVYVEGLTLTLKSIVGQYRSRLTWRTDLTTDGGATPPVIREWAPVGLGQIAIWPTDPVGGTVLQFDGVRLTPILVLDADTLDLGNEEIGILLDEALWILSFKRPSILAEMQPRHQRFLEACLERNDLLRKSSFFRHALGLDQEQRLEPTRSSTSQTPTTAGG
jgi:hypothetical protein